MKNLVVKLNGQHLMRYSLLISNYKLSYNKYDPQISKQLENFRSFGFLINQNKSSNVFHNILPISHNHQQQYRLLALQGEATPENRNNYFKCVDLIIPIEQIPHKYSQEREENSEIHNM